MKLLATCVLGIVALSFGLAQAYSGDQVPWDWASDYTVPNPTPLNAGSTTCTDIIVPGKVGESSSRSANNSTEDCKPGKSGVGELFQPIEKVRSTPDSLGH